MQQIVPEPVDSGEVTILADNFFDGLLVSEGAASCTGYKAVHAIYARLPDAFYQSSVLTTFAL